MPIIIIERPNQSANKAQRFNIFIDTIKVGSIGNDEIVQFKVSPRKHEIEIRNNWLNGSKTIDLDFTDNKNKTIRVSNSKFAILFAVIIAAIIGLIYALIEIHFNLETTWLTELIFILFLSALVIIPFFRKYFWKVEEVKDK